MNKVLKVVDVIGYYFWTFCLACFVFAIGVSVGGVIVGVIALGLSWLMLKNAPSF